MGWIAIRLRYETLHKILMLLALAVSMVFLASYLFYHFAVMEMEPTRFKGEGIGELSAQMEAEDARRDQAQQEAMAEPAVWQEPEAQAEPETEIEASADAEADMDMEAEI